MLWVMADASCEEPTAPAASFSLVTAFAASFAEWQGSQRRRDDVSLLAFGTGAGA